MRIFVRTTSDASLFLARVAAGAVLLPHGLQKALGLFGGAGWTGTTDYFTQQLGVPYVVAALVILAESVGALGLILGVMGRLCALGNLIVMGGAVYMVHWENGFFMNWYDNPARSEGFEYHILMGALLLTVVIGGSGPLSVDSYYVSRRRG